ncbi:TPA: hypothetical protein U1B12_002038 [Streptococcus suis]|uniref:hypothetical protein n=2 Tax=Streptococcus suis TaxID=1307 RepID=UPI00209B7394|nr:hypothetical protein [Streptococcus suis]MCO8199346.1 hypothetical protein [Streptococcus suis]MCO8208480.1 hypothetical protein [Streptococcus suis]MCO8217097.1 hypothetical protein [Streptococcus suis]HEM3468851.1 hypothetical protein [Streptococcus suis]HEM3479600.1 hypothetical protein [Streptococcus suis]
MNKRIRKKREQEVRLAAVATLALATSASLDGLAGIVEEVVQRMECFEKDSSKNVQSINKLFEQQGLLIKELQEQVKQLQKPWYKRKGQ